MNPGICVFFSVNAVYRVSITTLLSEHAVDFVFFSDEKVFTVASPVNLQNDRVYTRRAMWRSATSLLNACVVDQRSPRRWWCPLLSQNWAALSCFFSSRGWKWTADTGMMSVEDIANQSNVVFETWYTAWLISGVHVSQGSAETLVRGGGITNHHLIAFFISNISAKNYQNRLMCVEVTVCNISVFFLRTSVHTGTA